MSAAKKSLKGFFASLAVLLLCMGTASAQEFGAQVVTGNTYTCYFLSVPDIVASNVTFNEKGGMTLSSFPGNGFYFTLTNLFAGTYWSLDATIGSKKGDLLFYMIGTTFDPLIVGTGIMVIEYDEFYAMAFFGVRNTEGEL